MLYEKLAKLYQINRKIEYLEAQLAIITNERNYIETKIEVMESLKKMETPANKIFEVLQELDNYYYGEKKED